MRRKIGKNVREMKNSNFSVCLYFSVCCSRSLYLPAASNVTIGQQNVIGFDMLQSFWAFSGYDIRWPSKPLRAHLCSFHEASVFVFISCFIFDLVFTMLHCCLSYKHQSRFIWLSLNGKCINIPRGKCGREGKSKRKRENNVYNNVSLFLFQQFWNELICVSVQGVNAFLFVFLS